MNSADTAPQLPVLREEATSSQPRKPLFLPARALAHSSEHLPSLPALAPLGPAPDPCTWTKIVGSQPW